MDKERLRSGNEPLDASRNSAPPSPRTPEQAFEELYPTTKRLFFLFKQGFKKTNLQAAEFFALLRTYTKSKSSPVGSALHFLSYEEAMEMIRESLLQTERSTPDQVLRARKRLNAHLENKIIAIFHMTSAVVHVPTHMSVMLEEMCAASGYIHSCGDLVFTGNTKTVEKTLFSAAILDAIDRNSTEERKCLLVPYCHEDFSGRDKDKTLFLHNGLDDVKMHINKAYLRQDPLHQVLTDIVNCRPASVCMAPSDYRKSKSYFQGHFPKSQMVTLWVISDFGYSVPALNPSNERFLICYRQRFKNENLYHIYEENKPAWASHTTLPHTLAGAMINVVRPWLPKGAQICDPFSGSGTIFLEAQKFTDLQCTACDKSALARVMLSDNIAFFSSEVGELSSLSGELQSFRKAREAIYPHGKGRPSREIAALKRIAEVVGVWSSKCDDDFLMLSQEDVDWGISRVGAQLVDRVALYCALRASVRGRVTVQRQEEDWADVFDREIEALIGQIDNHIDELEGVKHRFLESGSSLVEGSYSPGILPPKPYESRIDLFGSGAFQLQEVAKLPKATFDAVICDPPYGFNTETDPSAAAIFAEELVSKVVDSVKPGGGQIVMAAPRFSLSGREIPLHLRSDYLGRAVLDYCVKTGRQCWKPAMIMPCPLSDHIQAPYYWRSEKALVRRILHFWVKPSEAVDRTAPSA